MLYYYDYDFHKEPQDQHKVPHGKAPDITLPPDWEQSVSNLAEFMTLENGDLVMDGQHGGKLFVTTVPPRQDGKDDPDGHTEFFYYSEHTKNKLFTYPGFPKPVHTPKSPNCKHEIREVPGKGRGVFATCDMHPGDLIWAERPFMANNIVLLPQNGFNPQSHHTESQFHALKFYALERMFEVIISRMTPERRAEFMSLANSHKEDGSGPILGILRTNQLDIRMVEGQAKPGQESRHDPLQYVATGYAASLMNHTCVPNIILTFDYASFSIRVHARAHIKKGDELGFSYVGAAQGYQTVAERQQALSPYSFRCTCRLCVADEETNTSFLTFTPRSYILAQFVFIELLKEDFRDPFHRKSPAQKRAQLEYYESKLKMAEALQRESDTYGHFGEQHLLCLLHELCKRVGNEKKRRRYAILVSRWAKCYELEFQSWL